MHSERVVGIALREARRPSKYRSEMRVIQTSAG